MDQDFLFKYSHGSHRRLRPLESFNQISSLEVNAGTISDENDENCPTNKSATKRRKYDTYSKLNENVNPKLFEKQAKKHCEILDKAVALVLPDHGKMMVNFLENIFMKPDQNQILHLVLYLDGINLKELVHYKNLKFDVVTLNTNQLVTALDVVRCSLIASSTRNHAIKENVGFGWRNLLTNLEKPLVIQLIEQCQDNLMFNDLLLILADHLPTKAPILILFPLPNPLVQLDTYFTSRLISSHRISIEIFNQTTIDDHEENEVCPVRQLLDRLSSDEGFLLRFDHEFITLFYQFYRENPIDWLEPLAGCLRLLILKHFWDSSNRRLHANLNICCLFKSFDRLTSILGNSAIHNTQFWPLVAPLINISVDSFKQKDVLENIRASMPEFERLFLLESESLQEKPGHEKFLKSASQLISQISQLANSDNHNPEATDPLKEHYRTAADFKTHSKLRLQKILEPQKKLIEHLQKLYQLLANFRLQALGGLLIDYDDENESICESFLGSLYHSQRQCIERYRSTAKERAFTEFFNQILLAPKSFHPAHLFFNRHRETARKKWIEFYANLAQFEHLGFINFYRSSKLVHRNCFYF